MLVVCRYVIFWCVRYCSVIVTGASAGRNTRYLMNCESWFSPISINSLFKSYVNLELSSLEKRMFDNGMNLMTFERVDTFVVYFESALLVFLPHFLILSYKGLLKPLWSLCDVIAFSGQWIVLSKQCFLMKDVWYHKPIELSALIWLSFQRFLSHFAIMLLVSHYYLWQCNSFVFLFKTPFG